MGDANDDSDGARRAPRKEGATGARVGATTAAASAEGEMSNHSSRASDVFRSPEAQGICEMVSDGAGDLSLVI